MAAIRILACVAAASALQAPAQTRRPATKLQALGVVEGLGALAVGGGLAVLLSEDNRDIDDKTEVERYFNGEEGFGRWNKIYSESDDVNGVQQEIRDGHAQTIDKVLSWAEADGRTVCDLGCGVGSLAIPLAQKGATVSASDISNAMATEASKRAAAAGITTATFETSDMENVSGEYDTVSCIDVMQQHNQRTSLRHYTDSENSPLLEVISELDGVGKENIYLAHGSGRLLKQCIPYLIKQKIMSSPIRIARHLLTKRAFPVISGRLTYFKVPIKANRLVCK